MNTAFPLFCYTASRNCPKPDTNIRLTETIDSPRDVTRVENRFALQIRRELKALGAPKLRPIRRTVKRPSLECRILTFR